MKKAYKFKFDAPVQEIILYANNQRGVIRKWIEMINPLWDNGADITVQFLGKTEDPPYIADLKKVYEMMQKYGCSYEELLDVEYELKRRNVI